MSKPSPALEALIEAYARAKGVTLPAGFNPKDSYLFHSIFITKQGDTVNVTFSPLTGAKLQVKVLDTVYDFESPTEIIEVLNAAKNTRVVGKVRMQLDGKVVRFFDATNTEVDTIYTATSAQDFKEICGAFGGAEECSMVLAQCALKSFDDCKKNINNGQFSFLNTENDAKKLLQALAFLSKLGFSKWKATGLIEDVAEWANTPIAKQINPSDALKIQLGNMVKALNASSIIKDLQKPGASVLSSPTLDEIKRAVAEGNVTYHRYVTPYGPFPYPFVGIGIGKGGGITEQVNTKLQAQFNKLKSILASAGQQFDKATDEAISKAILEVKNAEENLPILINDATEKLNSGAKETIIKVENLKKADGNFIDLKDFNASYEKLHVSLGKVIGAFNNTYLIMGTTMRKAADVTAENLVRQGYKKPEKVLLIQ